MYGLCVSAGMSPEYFKRELRPYEADAFLAGASRRVRTSWEQTRLCVWGSLLPWIKGLRPGDVMSFDWDVDAVASVDPSAAASAREWAMCIEKMFDSHARYDSEASPRQ